MVLINELMGEFGLYHFGLCFIVFISRFGIAFHQMAIIFLAPPAHYRCPGVNVTCCDNPVYNTSVFKKTIVTEWNLICKKSWLKDLNQTIFQFGVLAGSLLFGMASDKYGRRPTLIISVVTEIITGVMASFLPDYWSFTIVRMILGFSVGGIMVITFVIVMEFVGSQKRDVVTTLFHIPFTAGHVMLAAFGYYIRDYTYFQLSISLINVVLLVYICVLPETPRWLLAMNKTEEAVILIEQVAKINKLPVQDIRNKIELYQFEHRIVKRRSTVLNLFRTPNLRRNILVMSFVWLACSYCFYGMAYYISHLTGDVYINVVSSGGVCLCGCLIALPLIIFTNRKTDVIVLNIISSCCILIVALVPEGKASVVLGCVGVMCCYIVFIVVYLYCSEMFPTVVRNAALGICSMMARLGAMLAPFIADLRKYGQWCAPVAFAIFPIAAALLCILLPETKDCELLMTIEEGEDMLRKRRRLPKATERRQQDPVSSQD
ncbi:organic cation transporter protein-like [Anticarsia gemmatalis]|uniref:organic cation transporter protein-like n=1 Tax=Anticarsia gemmatalis TaxID=129554 RepID=UPI003F776B23